MALRRFISSLTSKNVKFGVFASSYLRESFLIFGLVENQGPVSERIMLNFALNNIALFRLLRKGENHRLMKTFHP